MNRGNGPQEVDTIPQEQKTASPLPPSPPAVGAPMVKHRGRKKGEPRPPARPMDIIYSEKMDRTFHTATLLVRRLKSLSRDKYVKESAVAKERFNAFLATLKAKVDEIKPSGEADEETLSDWTG